MGKKRAFSSLPFLTLSSSSAPREVWGKNGLPSKRADGRINPFPLPAWPQYQPPRYYADPEQGTWRFDRKQVGGTRQRACLSPAAPCLPAPRARSRGAGAQLRVSGALCPHATPCTPTPRRHRRLPRRPGLRACSHSFAHPERGCRASPAVCLRIRFPLNPAVRIRGPGGRIRPLLSHLWPST